MKKTYLAWIFSSTDYYKSIIPSYYLLKQLSKNFTKVYLINLENLKLFKDFHSNEPKLEKIDNVKQDFSFNENVEYFCPKNKSEFKNFMENKYIVAISNLGRHLSDIPLHIYLSKYNTKLVQVSFVGNIQETSIEITNILKFIIYFINKNISYKIITILSILKIVPKVDIRFTSNSRLVFKKNLLRKFIEYFKIAYVKKYILVNSKSYDLSIENKKKITQENIAYLDPMIDNVEMKAIRGEINKENIQKHYLQLIRFLKEIELFFNKKIIVCLHPRDNYLEKKEIFKDFKVVQYKTQETILKSFLVVFFETSAIIDAIILKKKLLTLYSNLIDATYKHGSDRYVKELGITQFNINDLDKYQYLNKIFSIMEKTTPNYENYIKKNIKPDTDEPGYLKIVRILKEKYFIS